MEQSLERSMQLLIAQMERNETRHTQLQRNFRWLSIAFGLTLVLLVGMSLKVQFIQEAKAESIIKELEVDMHNLNKILGGGAEFVETIKKDQMDKKLLSAMSKIGDIVNNLDAILKALATEENNEALKNLASMVNSGGIADAVRSLEDDMSSMSHNMYIMTVDMHRMSGTATPAMGRMYDMMRFIPTP